MRRKAGEALELRRMEWEQRQRQICSSPSQCGRPGKATSASTFGKAAEADNVRSKSWHDDGWSAEMTARTPENLTVRPRRQRCHLGAAMAWLHKERSMASCGCELRLPTGMGCELENLCLCSLA